MTSARQARWLLDELDGLVDEGVLERQAAAALRARYAESAARASGWTTTLFASLGGVLVGSGVILLLAHNWSELSRAARTVVALVPLVTAQALALWIVLRRPGSAAGREGVGALWFLAVGAAIALVAQTYHLHGDLASFLLTWMLLALPVVFLLEASLPCFLYLAGVASWAVAPQAEATRLWFPVLAALGAVHLAQRVASRRSDGWERTLTLALVATVATASPRVVLSGQPIPEPGVWLYAGLAATALLLGVGEPGRPWRRALAVAGAGGVALVALYGSFEDNWAHFGTRSVAAWPPASVDRWVALGLLAAPPIAAVALLVVRGRALDWPARLGGALPLVVAAAYLGRVALGESLVAFVTINLYILALGLVAALCGAREGRTRLATSGVALLAALIAIRFFDSELSFLWRGVGFVAAGALFLVANLLLARRARRAG